jgi:hypothetical protein
MLIAADKYKKEMSDDALKSKPSLEPDEEMYVDMLANEELTKIERKHERSPTFMKRLARSLAQKYLLSDQ